MEGATLLENKEEILKDFLESNPTGEEENLKEVEKEKEKENEDGQDHEGEEEHLEKLEDFIHSLETSKDKPIIFKAKEISPYSPSTLLEPATTDQELLNFLKAVAIH
eukprot:TRINITY_DN21624_c0_g1_i2.p1 TRINITY_DN21624_c0_g1~~TRINITY_DN21624_c0_g1_i2.p1  ORF type:complete len:107 (-),score=49.93 TRINITY_DN21624_c0_g1_i2:59-379(-)